MRNILFLLCISIISCGSHYDDNDNIITYSKGNNVYSRLFAISDSGLYKRLDIRSPWQGGDNIVYTYYLVQKGNSIPAKVDLSKIIYIPIESAVCMSTTHIAMIDALGDADGIIGVSGANYVSNKIVREGIKNKLVYDIGYDSNLNSELIARIKPDIVFVYGVGAESSGYVAKLKEAGITTLYICDYLETHPLAKSEWLKLFGTLYGKDDLARQIFDSVALRYEDVKDYISLNIKSEPKVMLGLPYKDKWFVSPGNSYISTLIKDAGGSYLWSDKSSKESMPLSIESVYIKGMDADFWLNTGIAESKAELLSVDNRFSQLPAVINGNIYNNSKTISQTGGNDYWETGAIYPDRILEDIASILHPELYGNHKFSYYKKIE